MSGTKQKAAQNPLTVEQCTHPALTVALWNRAAPGSAARANPAARTTTCTAGTAAPRPSGAHPRCVPRAAHGRPPRNCNCVRASTTGSARARTIDSSRSPSYGTP